MRPVTRRQWMSAATTLMAMLSLAATDVPSPMQALARLKSGNAQFATNPAAAVPGPGGIRSTDLDQRPYAAVVSCADTRTPTEVIFHASPGELFVVRVAGPVADKAVLGSLEYATERLDVPLIVLMGHEMCDVTKAALDTREPVSPNLGFLFKALRPADASSAAGTGSVRAAVLDSLEDEMNTVFAESSSIRRQADEGKVALVGAYYESSTGRVHFSAPVTLPPSFSH